MYGINNMITSPSRAEIEVDFTDEELLTYMKRAHEQDITFNQFVEQSLRRSIEEQEKVKVT